MIPNLKLEYIKIIVDRQMCLSHLFNLFDQNAISQQPRYGLHFIPAQLITDNNSNPTY